jgi:hypothetical protein
MVLDALHCCEKCYRLYSPHFKKWCKSCQINYFKENFADWTSGNGIIDKYIQEMQLNIIDYESIIFEWIPYKDFINIKKEGGYEISTVYSALWKNGPLSWQGYWLDKTYTYTYTRNSSYKKVGLKCLRNSHNNVDEFLKEIIKV